MRNIRLDRWAMRLAAAGALGFGFIVIAAVGPVGAVFTKSADVLVGTVTTAVKDSPLNSLHDHEWA